MKEEMILIILGAISVMATIIKIFSMKFKRDMYIEHLKHYEMGTSYLDDKILEDLFDVYLEEEK